MHLGAVIIRKIGMELCKVDPCVFRLFRDGVVVVIMFMWMTLLLQESLRRVII